MASVENKAQAVILALLARRKQRQNDVPQLPSSIGRDIGLVLLIDQIPTATQDRAPFAGVGVPAWPREQSASTVSDYPAQDPTKPSQRDALRSEEHTSELQSLRHL